MTHCFFKEKGNSTSSEKSFIIKKVFDTYPIAEVQKTFGAHGELIIRLYATIPEKINTDDPVFITIDGLLVPLYFKSFEPHGPHRVVVEFNDIETSELAAELIGKTIALKKEKEIKNKENTSSFLQYEVIDQQYGTLGTVIHFLDIPGNPCLQIDYKGRTVMIPFHEDIITKRDHKKRILQVVLPEGLLELY